MMKGRLTRIVISIVDIMVCPDALLTSSSSPLPLYWATTTVPPVERALKPQIKSAPKGLIMLTAAMESSPDELTKEVEKLSVRPCWCSYRSEYGR